MRPFEIALLIVNVLSLILCIRKRSKGILLETAGLNLGLLLGHAYFEGLRYQMVFSYGFVLLFGLCAFVKTSGRFDRARTPQVLKGIAFLLAFFALGLSAVLSAALPVFTLPKPTGRAAVGIHYFYLTDPTRTDPFLAGSPQKREMLVKVYYPAQPDDAKPFSPYFHGNPQLIRAFATFYSLPDFAFNQLNLVKTNAKDDLPASAAQRAYPVILFSHGAGNSVEVSTAQCEDLASHGYIVAAIDYPYVSAATAFPDRLVTAQQATTNFTAADPAEIITQLMADDARFVIDQLAEMNAGALASPFKGRLALDQIGTTGHSVGGAVAYNLAIDDPRIKAAIDLDGTVFVTPKVSASAAAGAAIAPFLMLANDQGHIQAIQSGTTQMRKFAEVPAGEQAMLLSMYGTEAAYQAAYAKAQQNMLGLTGVLKTSGNLYTIQGSDHMKFTDLGLFIGLRPLREQMGIHGATDPARVLVITRAVTLAFFDENLKRVYGNTVDSLRVTYPELRKVRIP